MDLVKLLMQQLGVDQKQAQGGLGLIFDLVKDKLGSAEFQQLSQAIPGIDELIQNAPQAGKGGGGLLGAVGSLVSSLTGGKGGLGDLAELVGGFSKLGLDPKMISQFVSVVMKFVEEQGGAGVKDLLNKVLKVG